VYDKVAFFDFEICNSVIQKLLLLFGLFNGRFNAHSHHLIANLYEVSVKGRNYRPCCSASSGLRKDNSE